MQNSFRAGNLFSVFTSCRGEHCPLAETLNYGDFGDEKENKPWQEMDSTHVTEQRGEVIVLYSVGT
jgi:hypothetical protein